MLKSRPTTSRMSGSEKEQTYHAAAVAIAIINEKHEALNKYREEAYAYIANNPGNFSFTFNMDFMKVKFILTLGYLQSGYANRRSREWQIENESLKIARETGAPYQEVKELFLLLMSKYVKF